MRRRLFSILVLGSLTLLTGCQVACTHGVCDCEFDDHCCTRSSHPHGAPSAVDGPASPRLLPPAESRTLPPPVAPAKGL